MAEDDTNLGPAIPTRFNVDIQSNLEEIAQHTGLDRSQVIRRAARVLIDEVKRRGDADWLKDQPPKKELSFLSNEKKKPVKAKRAHMTDQDWVSHSILGASSCGKFAASEANIIGEFKLPRGKYPPDCFGVRAEGDSMNIAPLQDGKKGIKPGEIAICRSREKQAWKSGDVVIVLHDGQTCIKRLTDHGVLVPESTNKKHEPLVVGRDAIVQAVVIGKA